MAHRKLLNAVSMLERIVALNEEYKKNIARYPEQRMAPVLEHELGAIAFLAKCRLKQRTNRKDVV